MGVKFNTKISNVAGLIKEQLHENSIFLKFYIIRPVYYGLQEINLSPELMPTYGFNISRNDLILVATENHGFIESAIH